MNPAGMMGEWLRRPFPLIAHFSLLVIVAILWTWSLVRVDEAALGSFGLVAILPVSALGALVIMVFGFVRAVHERPSTRLPGTYVAGLTVMLHGLPTFVYEHLRFSWAWEQVGIVDFIRRTGIVDPSIAVLPEYHNWPGFFGVNAVITSTSNLDSALSYAAWAPILFELLFVAAIYSLCTALTKDPRLVWTATLFFVVGNWVGQDYLAPQSVAFFLYVVVIGVLLRWYTNAKPPDSGGDTNQHALPAGGAVRLTVAAVLMVSLLAIAISHPLVAGIALVSIGALTLSSELSARWPFWVMAAFTSAWFLGPARSFVLSNNIFDSGILEIGQLRASPVARLTSSIVLGLAVWGWFSRMQLRLPSKSLIILAGVPAGVAFVSSHGAESLLLGYMFSLPFLGFLAASYWFPNNEPTRRGRSRRSLFTAVMVVMAGLLLAGFTADTREVFTPDEVAASEFIIDHGRPGSLVVEANSDYPRFHREYEKFSYRLLDDASVDSVERLLRDPAAEIAEWFDVSAPGKGGYVLITRSQRWSITSLGTLVSPTLDTIEMSLLESDQFDLVFDSPSARVFSIVESS